MALEATTGELHAELTVADRRAAATSASSPGHVPSIPNAASPSRTAATSRAASSASSSTAARPGARAPPQAHGPDPRPAPAPAARATRIHAAAVARAAQPEPTSPRPRLARPGPNSACSLDHRADLVCRAYPHPARLRRHLHDLAMPSRPRRRHSDRACWLSPRLDDPLERAARKRSGAPCPRARRHAAARSPLEVERPQCGDRRAQRRGFPQPSAPPGPPRPRPPPHLLGQTAGETRFPSEGTSFRHARRRGPRASRDRQLPPSLARRGTASSTALCTASP